MIPLQILLGSRGTAPSPPSPPIPGTPIYLGSVTSASTPSSLAITTIADSPAGNSIVLFHYANAFTGPISGIVDSAGNSYQGADNGFTNGKHIETWNSSTSLHLPSGSLITATFSAAAFRAGILALSIPHLGAYDSGAYIESEATGTSVSLSIDPTNNNEILLGLLTTASNPGTMTAPSGFTALTNASGSAFMYPFYKILATKANTTFNPSWVNSISYQALGIAYGGA